MASEESSKNLSLSDVGDRLSKFGMVKFLPLTL